MPVVVHTRPGEFVYFMDGRPETEDTTLAPSDPRRNIRHIDASQLTSTDWAALQEMDRRVREQMAQRPPADAWRGAPLVRTTAGADTLPPAAPRPIPDGSGAVGIVTPGMHSAAAGPGSSPLTGPRAGTGTFGPTNPIGASPSFGEQSPGIPPAAANPYAGVRFGTSPDPMTRGAPPTSGLGTGVPLVSATGDTGRPVVEPSPLAGMVRGIANVLPGGPMSLPAPMRFGEPVSQTGMQESVTGTSQSPGGALIGALQGNLSPRPVQVINADGTVTERINGQWVTRQALPSEGGYDPLSSVRTPPSQPQAEFGGRGRGLGEPVVGNLEGQTITGESGQQLQVIRQNPATGELLEVEINGTRYTWDKTLGRWRAGGEMGAPIMGPSGGGGSGKLPKKKKRYSYY